MNARIDKLEKDVATLKVELASLHENGAKSADVEVIKVKLDLLTERVDTLAAQIGALAAHMDANFVTKAEFAQQTDQIQFLRERVDELKERFETVLPTLATKDDLREQGKHFEAMISHLVTEAAYERGRAETRAWMLGVALSLLVALGGLQYSFYVSLNNRFDAVEHRLAQLENRVDKLSERVDKLAARQE